MSFTSRRVGLTTWANVVLGAVYVVAAIVVVLLVNRHDKEVAVTNATDTASLLLERNLAVTRFFKEELVPATSRLVAAGPNPTAYNPVLTSSIYATRRLDELVHEGGRAGYRSKRATIDARTPANEADPFERDFILRTRADPALVRLSAVRTIDGAPYLQILARSPPLGASCLECHDTPARAPPELVSRYGATRGFGRHVGDITSAISIRMPLAGAYAAADAFALRLSAALVAVLLLLYGAQVLIHRRFVLVPVARLRDAARLLARGEVPAEPPVQPAAAELQDLSEAFHGMARQIARQRDGLEAAVEARTRELTEALGANERLVTELRGALLSVKTLTGLLPICAWCGKVRSDEGYWNRIEDYLSAHTSARVTHGMCPDCYADNLDRIPRRAGGDPPGEA